METQTPRTVNLEVKRSITIDVLQDNMLVVRKDEEPNGTFCTSAKQFGDVFRKKLEHPFAAERQKRQKKEKPAKPSEKPALPGKK